MHKKESMLDFKMQLDTSNQCLQRQLKLDQTPLTKIERKYGITIDIINNEYVLHGLREKTTQAAQELSIMEFQLRSKIKKIDIEDKQQLKALDSQSKSFWEKGFHLKISSEQRVKQNLNQFQQLNSNSVLSQRLNQTQSVQPQQSPLAFQWAYKVFPKDPNYHERSDTVNDWFNFDYDQNVQIEKHFQDCIKKAKIGKRMSITGDMGQSKNGFFYEVFGLSADPDDWYEVNIQTQRQRQLKRISYSQESMNGSNSHRSLNQSSMSNIQPSTNQYRGIGIPSRSYIQPQERYEVLVVEGIASDIQDFQQELDKIVVLQKLKKPQQKTVFSLVGYQNIIGAKICTALTSAIKSKHKCDLIVKTTHLKIKGNNHIQAYEYLINALNIIKMHYVPDTWEELENYFNESSTPKNFELKSTSEEFKKIKDLFYNGGCREPIYKIFRIQNRDVWGRFQQEKNKLRIKNGSDPLVYDLFHGTRETIPELVHSGDEGFDIRFSKQGMWGRAIYFAARSDYSHQYSYVNPLGGRGMFVANVLIGDTVLLEPDNKLVVPPPKPDGKQKYDSVHGTANNCDVYMVYSNSRAYPAYYIHYGVPSNSLLHRF
eukprot:403364236